MLRTQLLLAQLSSKCGESSFLLICRYFIRPIYYIFKLFEPSFKNWRILCKNPDFHFSLKNVFISQGNNQLERYSVSSIQSRHALQSLPQFRFYPSIFCPDFKAGTISISHCCFSYNRENVPLKIKTGYRGWRFSRKRRQCSLFISSRFIEI